MGNPSAPGGISGAANAALGARPTADSDADGERHARAALGQLKISLTGEAHGAARRGGLFLMIGVVLLGLLIAHLGAAEIVSMLFAVGWTFAVVLVLHVAHQGCRSIALWLCVPRGYAVSHRDALFIRVSGEAVRFLTFTGPFLAEPAKAWLFKRRGLSMVDGFTATGTEYVAYTSVSAVMAIGAVAYLLRRADLGPDVAGLALLMPVVFVATGFAVCVALVRGRTPLGQAARWLMGETTRVHRRWHPKIESLCAFERRLGMTIRERPAALAGVLAIELCAQILLVWEAYWILRGLDVIPDWHVPLIIEGGAKATAAFFVIPGQVGAAEGMYAALFGALGLSVTAGVTMAFVRRLRTLVVAAAGLLALRVLLNRVPLDATSQSKE